MLTFHIKSFARSRDVWRWDHSSKKHIKKALQTHLDADRSTQTRLIALQCKGSSFAHCCNVIIAAKKNVIVLREAVSTHWSALSNCTAYSHTNNTQGTVVVNWRTDVCLLCKVRRGLGNYRQAGLLECRLPLSTQSLTYGLHECLH